MVRIPNTAEREPESLQGFVEDAIRTMALDPKRSGGKLPSTAELCAMLKASSSTVNKALTNLKREGLISSRQGKGFFINDGRARQGTGAVAILAAQSIHFDHPVLGRSAAAIQRALLKHGLRTVLLGMDTERPNGANGSGRNSLLSNETLVNPNFFDALIILGLAASTVPRPLQPAAIMRLSESIPVGVVDGQYMGISENVAQCWNDYEAGCMMAVSHLVGLGHKDIALITGEREDCTARMQRRGAELALQLHHDKGVSVRALHSRLRFSEEGGEHIARQLLESGKFPTGLIAGSDEIARGAYQVLTEKRLQVPDDVSLVTFNNWSSVEGIPIPATSVMVDYGASAAACAEELARILSDRSQAPNEIRYPTKLVVRATTACPEKRNT